MAEGKPFAKRYKHRKTSGNGLHMRMYAFYKKARDSKKRMIQ
ncbi:hypothetical protein HMPREF9406_2653 [Clostridium sp. HGF2]|nr:hypothetical protein HMPREF9406_2653 [Clostridium sp. HGF2]